MNITITQQSLDEMSFERGLWPAAQLGDVRRVAELLRRRRSADELDSSGLTALHYACREGHLAVCVLLLDAGAAIDAPSRSGVTPLQRAAAAGHCNVVELLLPRGASLTAVDQRGRDAAAAARAASQVATEQLLQRFNRE
jgi:ankyrin repeat protein